VISLGYCHELLIAGNMGRQKRTNPVNFSLRAVGKIVSIVTSVFILFTSSLLVGAEPKKVRIGFTEGRISVGWAVIAPNGSNS